MKPFYSFIFACLLVSCNTSPKALTAQAIIDKAIENHCSGSCEKSTITFNFRNTNYKSIKNGGAFQYERIIEDSLGIIRDVLSNSDFKRYLNGKLLQIPDAIKLKFSNSVNSVHYFAQLPYGLNAAAVKKEFLGEDTIHGKTYYQIGVTFNEEGGGTDHDDTFVYWINKTDFTLDYLAYRYAVNGGGIRFREAYNKRVIEGITFADYNNYKPETLDVALVELDGLFEKGKLQLLSKVETEAVKVTLNE